MLSKYFLLVLPLVSLAACGDSAGEPVLSSPDGGAPVEDGGVGSASDGGAQDAAPADAAPAAPSPVGAWLIDESGGYWRAAYRYRLNADGTMAFSYERRDVNAQFAGCRQVYSGAGTWTVQGTNLDVVLTSGTAERTIAPGERRCGIGEDLRYDARPMSANELTAQDLANGRYAFRGPNLITTTSYSGGQEFPHEWVPAP